MLFFLCKEQQTRAIYTKRSEIAGQLQERGPALHVAGLPLPLWCRADVTS